MTTTHWKAVNPGTSQHTRVVNDNGRNSTIAICPNGHASQIVREHNAHAALVEALQSAQTTLVSIKDFIGDMTDSHIRTGKRIPAASILQQVIDMAENQALETQAALWLANGD